MTEPEVSMQAAIGYDLLFANPQFYDYIHNIEFRSDGTVELIDGAGQMVNIVIVGKYRFLEDFGLTAQIEFFELAEVNPFGEKEKLRDLNPLTIRVSREHGEFAFAEEVIWKIEKEDQYPCIMFRQRFVFENDPLAYAQGAQEHNLYNQTEPKEMIESARYYYLRADQLKLTMREVLDLGFSKEELWKPSHLKKSSDHAS